MRAREWKPGEVAMVGSRPALRVDNDGDIYFIDSTALHWRHEDGSARPLVVIDPEDTEQVERLANTYYSSFPGTDRPRVGSGVTAALQAALREFANPTPPRIDEPGTWGVVKASCPHSDTRREWVHHPDGNWWPAFDYSTVPERTPLPDDWADLIDPVLVREGVTQ